MKEILSLAGYEYKKIFQRKVSIIALGAVLLLTLFSGAAMLLGQVYVEGEIAEGHGEQLKEQRQAVEELAGTPIDDKLLGEAERAYGNIISEEFRVDTEEGWEAYKASIYPYSFIQNMCAKLKANYGNTGQAMTGEEFYGLREAYMKQGYESEKLSAGETAKHISEMKKLDTPMTYGWTNGYQRYNQLVFMDGMFLAFAVAICIAPLFAGEYTSHVDQLILTSRYGKKQGNFCKTVDRIFVCFFSGICDESVAAFGNWYSLWTGKLESAHSVYYGWIFPKRADKSAYYDSDCGSVSDTCHLYDWSSGDFLFPEDEITLWCYHCSILADFCAAVSYGSTFRYAFFLFADSILAKWCHGRTYDF